MADIQTKSAEKEQKKDPEKNGTSSADEKTSGTAENGDHDPYFPPVVSLPEVEVPSGEDEEQELFRMRAKLYRFDSNVGDPDSPPEWKERGTGDVKLLENKANKGRIRMLMRRDKTLKICANHFIRPWMILKNMKGSDKAFMWQVHADFADEEIKTETLAIRFANPDNASKFKKAFDQAVITVTEAEAKKIIIGEGEIVIEQHSGSPNKDDQKNEEAVGEALNKLDISEKS